MRRFYLPLIVVIVVILLFVGLNWSPPGQVEPVVEEQGRAKQSPSYSSSFKPKEVVFGVGDVEVAAHVMTQLAPKSRNPSARVRDVSTPKKRLTREVVDFFPPYPEEVWVQVQVVNEENYPEHALHIKTTVSLDDKPIKTFSIVTGPDAQELHQVELNISELSGGTLPESFLLQSTSVITLYKFTDVSEIDVDDPPDAKAVDIATVTGNTLRVTFRS